MLEVDPNIPDQVIGQFVLKDATGALVAADSTPTVAIVLCDGSSALNIAAYVSTATTGHYLVQLDTLPSTSPDFQEMTYGPFFARVSFAVDGVNDIVPIPPFRFKTAFNYVEVIADGGNTATVFKIGAVRTQLAQATGDAVFAIAVCLVGSVAGQLAEVDAYDHGTGFITLKRALTAAPAAGDIFRLINS